MFRLTIGIHRLVSLHINAFILTDTVSDNTYQYPSDVKLSLINVRQYQITNQIGYQIIDMIDNPDFMLIDRLLEDCIEETVCDRWQYLIDDILNGNGYQLPIQLLSEYFSVDTSKLTNDWTKSIILTNRDDYQLPVDINGTPLVITTNSFYIVEVLNKEQLGKLLILLDNYIDDNKFDQLREHIRLNINQK